MISPKYQSRKNRKMCIACPCYPGPGKLIKEAKWVIDMGPETNAQTVLRPRAEEYSSCIHLEVTVEASRIPLLMEQFLKTALFQLGHQ